MVRWYALQLGPSTFGIFDTFETEDRKAHLGGKIAAALMANAQVPLAKDTVIEQVDLIAINNADYRIALLSSGVHGLVLCRQPRHKNNAAKWQ